MKNKITLKQKNTYEAFVGGISLGTFDLESEWNGFTKLTNKTGEIIVNRAELSTQALGVVFGQDEEVDVVKASTEIASIIIRENKKIAGDSEINNKS